MSISCLGDHSRHPSGSPPLVSRSAWRLCSALILSSMMAEKLTPAIFYIWQFCRAMCVPCRRSGNGRAERRAVALVAGIGTATWSKQSLRRSNTLAVIWQLVALLGTVISRSDVALCSDASIRTASRRPTNPSAIAVVTAGAVIALTGGGRATIGLFGIGVEMSAILSIRHKKTSRKSMMARVAVLLLVLSTPAMMWAVERRSVAARISSDEKAKGHDCGTPNDDRGPPAGRRAQSIFVSANLAAIRNARVVELREQLCWSSQRLVLVWEELGNCRIDRVANDALLESGGRARRLCVV